MNKMMTLHGVTCGQSWCCCGFSLWDTISYRRGDLLFFAAFEIKIPLSINNEPYFTVCSWENGL